MPLSFIVYFYFGAINLLALLLMGVDKGKAKHGGRRIPERILFLFALLGGSMGVLVGMIVFRHKSRHLKFIIGIPLIVAFQMVVLLFWFVK